VILDSSAVVATILGGPAAECLGRIIGEAYECRIGAPAYLEAAMLLTGRLGPEGRLLLAHFMYGRPVEVVEFGEAHWRMAQSAFARFGRGNHPAALNFGACLTYSIAYMAGEPLLCTGDNFSQTDLELVPYEV
jgi:ribonuclease VapC